VLVSGPELVAALLELADQTRALAAEVAALRAELSRVPDQVCDRLDDRGFAVAAPPTSRGAS
jgi:hypothetical protein